MAGIGPMSFGERELTPRLTLEVAVVVRPDWRVRAGTWLMRLGARLAGMGYREVDA